MKSRVFKNCTLLSWESLDRYGIKAGTVTRMNTALHAPEGVDRKEILQNRKVLSKALGVDPSHWICGNQIHGCESVILTEKNRGQGAFSPSTALQETDALILSEPGLAALIFTADCLPLLLFDRQKRTGALIHAGWRGIAGGIVPSVLERMCSDLDSKKEDILAAAGPGVNSCCYQIDAPVYQRITEAYPETEASFIPDGDGHWRFSLEEAVFLQLRSRGVSPDRMEGSGLCSGCNTDLFSWRREGALTGRMGTYLCL